MQAIIAFPDIAALALQPVAGIPLLMRAVLTAARAGGKEILLICPDSLSDKFVHQFMDTAVAQPGVRIDMIRVREFDPRASSSWTPLNRHLKEQFLWVPWNWVTTKKFLANLPLVELPSVDWAKPAYTKLNEVVRDNTLFDPPRPRGCRGHLSRERGECGTFFGGTFRQRFSMVSIPLSIGVFAVPS